MKTKKLNENEIDRRVIEQADDDSAWERPVKVKRDKTSLTLPANLAARAAFLARLHRKARCVNNRPECTRDIHPKWTTGIHPYCTTLPGVIRTGIRNGFLFAGG